MEPVIWESTSLSEKLEECSSSKEREARSLALEKAYVHDVYQQITSHLSPDSRHRVWPRVKQFILDLEPGSVVCDVGCGNGKYLDFNPPVYKIGLDRCSNLTNMARGKEHEVLLCDNLALPFRDECFDAVLSIAVIHHFATFERRVAAIQELARVLRIGGRLMVSVWAMEQRHRKFESQDVLVPWNRPIASSSDDKTSSIERDLNSTTTTTSDDDTTHYHAYTQTSDSDSFPSLSRECRRRGRIRHRGRSIDPTCPSSSQSSSDLSSPNESCYSFVRRALQKLAGTKRNRGNRRPWFLHGLDIPNQDGSNEPLASIEDESDRLVGGNFNQSDNFVPIELRQLESTDFVELFQLRESKTRSLKQVEGVACPQRRRTLETTCDLHHSDTSPIATQPKSKSLSDLFGLLPMGLLRSHKKITIPESRKEKVETFTSAGSEQSESLQSSNDETQFPEFARHKAVQTDDLEVDPDMDTSPPADLSSSVKVTLPPSPEKLNKSLRPTLVKQKQSVGSFSHYSIENFAEFESGRGESNGAESGESQGKQALSPIRWGDIKQSVKNLPEFKQSNTLQPPPFTSTRGGLTPASSFWKQTSLNEDLIFTERLKEKERLKQNIQKQCSLNEELIYKRENTRWDQMKEAILNPANVKCLQMLKTGISSRFRGSDSFGGGGSSDNTSGAQPKQPIQATSSLKNGIARILQNWKNSDDRPESGAASGPSFMEGTASSVFLGSRRGSKEGTTRRGIFTPFFLRRSSVGSLNSQQKEVVDPNTSSNVLSPPPYMKRGPSDNELVQDVQGGANNGNKLIPGVRHARKLSREDGSDSSKDSSFQSDTSVDSEDSFASVIFIPKTTSMDNTTGEALCFNSESRANSTDSDRSPKSPALRLSPPNHNVPKSPSPLASELIRRRSPDVVSPTASAQLQSLGPESGTKFIFDGSETKLTPPLVCLRASSPTSTDGKSVSGAAGVQQLSGISPSAEKFKVEGTRARTAGMFAAGETQSVRLLRRTLPKSFAVELYNPETDDADTSDSSSSSPNSVSSVVSVKEEKLPISSSPREESLALPVSKQDEGQEPQVRDTNQDTSISFQSATPEADINIESSTHKQHEQNKILAHGIFEAAASMVSSLENLVSQSSPKACRKLTLSRLGSTTDWLSSLPSDSSQHGSTTMHHSQRGSLERRHPGEKILLGEVKKFQQKGPDAKWPTSIVDESPPNTAKLCPSVSLPSPVGSSSVDFPEPGQKALELIKLAGESDEKDSLFDSIENLTGKQPSRNPSIDSSVRMSSTCSCSIRGGDSFDSWTSAKSSFTNSSSTHHKTSLPSLIPLQTQSSDPTRRMGSTINRKSLRPDSSKSSSLAGEDTEDSTALTYHRYYHVFREGELDKLIEKYVQNLHIISSYYDHANWCIIAEKVQVWTI